MDTTLAPQNTANPQAGDIWLPRELTDETVVVTGFIEDDKINHVHFSTLDGVAHVASLDYFENSFTKRPAA